jgi:hypothetical protein
MLRQRGEFDDMGRFYALKSAARLPDRLGFGPFVRKNAFAGDRPIVMIFLAKTLTFTRVMMYDNVNK